jgi:hypothetical protein
VFEVVVEYLFHLLEEEVEGVGQYQFAQGVVVEEVE